MRSNPSKFLITELLIGSLYCFLIRVILLKIWISIRCILYCTLKAVNPLITKGRYTFSLLCLDCKIEEEMGYLILQQSILKLQVLFIFRNVHNC